MMSILKHGSIHLTEHNYYMKSLNNSKDKCMILENIKSIISELVLMNVEEIQEEDTLAILGVDSLLTVELILRIEEKYDITFESSDINFKNFEFVKSVVNRTERYIK